MRKKIAQRRGRNHHPTNSTHHTIHIHTNPTNLNVPSYPAAASSSHSPSLSLQTHTHTQMARTKTTNRLTGAEMPPPNTRSTQARTQQEREESPQSEHSPFSKFPCVKNSFMAFSIRD
ncbi:hypothetical protein PIB30_028602 [Stylosanthes scabra]|uniref:Uncharacterized protein n=1 Tax=Stylosanthes scabra TaxID=79078 RepID=A0ABU6XBV6_9FABA|nr:hypothetical protein [Stylosanthes scabra]